MASDSTYASDGVKLRFTRGQAETVLEWLKITCLACEDYVKALPQTASRTRREMEESVRRQKELLTEKPVDASMLDFEVTPPRGPEPEPEIVEPVVDPGPVADATAEVVDLASKIPVLRAGASEAEVVAHNLLVHQIFALKSLDAAKVAPSE